MEGQKKTAPLAGGAVLKKQMRSARIEEVIITTCCVGSGTEEDPNRIATEFWSKSGEWMGIYDPVLMAVFDRR